MYDLKSLLKWRGVGKAPMRFMTRQPRRVRLEVLAEEETALYVSEEAEKGHKQFIGRFEGFDVVSFTVQGVFTLEADGGPCKVWCPEFDTLAVEIPEAISFTRIMTRKQRNPELEAMMAKVTETMDRRIAQVEEDVTLRLQNERREEIQADERKAAERARRAKAKRDLDERASQLDQAEDEADEAADS